MWAKTDGSKDERSIRGFIVPTDVKGFQARDQKGKLSLRASDTSELVFQDVLLPADAVLPKSGGLKSPLMCLTQARYGIRGAPLAPRWRVSRRQSSTETRVMFDRPIGGFQIQQQRLADMLTEIVKAQLVALHLGRLKDAGTHCSRCRSPSATTSAWRPTSRARHAASSVQTTSPSTPRCGTWRTSRVSTPTRGRTTSAPVLGQAVTGLSAFK